MSLPLTPDKMTLGKIVNVTKLTHHFKFLHDQNTRHTCSKSTVVQYNADMQTPFVWTFTNMSFRKPVSKSTINTHSSFRPQRRLVGLPNLVILSLSSLYSLSASIFGTPSQAIMRMVMTALAQWWPARSRTRQSSFSVSLLRRMTWQETELIIILAFTSTGELDKHPESSVNLTTKMKWQLKHL